MSLLRLALMVFGAFRLLQGGKDLVLDNIQHTWLKFNPFSDIKLLQEKVNVRISIRNQNPFDIPIHLIEGRLSYQGTHIGNFRASNQKMLPSGGEVIWEIPVSYNTENALFTLQRLLEGSGAAKVPFDITMTAKATVKRKVVSHSFDNQIPIL